MKKSILEVVHDSAKELHKAGLVAECTMQELDVLCFPADRKLEKEIKTDLLRKD